MNFKISYHGKKMRNMALDAKSRVKHYLFLVYRHHLGVCNLGLWCLVMRKKGSVMHRYYSFAVRSLPKMTKCNSFMFFFIR